MKEWWCRSQVNISLNNVTNTHDTIIYTKLPMYAMLTTNPIVKVINNHANTVSTSIRINSDPSTFDFSYPDNPITSNRNDFYQAILHELGHAMGLAHVNDPTSLMYYMERADEPWNGRLESAKSAKSVHG